MKTKSFIKVAVVILPVLFTAQACNFLFGDLLGTTDQGSGTRGVFKSIDSGETWQQANATSGDTGLSSAQVYRLYIERFNPVNILAATLDSGVFASSDEAKSWGVLLPNFGTLEVFINPNNSQEIFAAGSAGGLATIYKSANRGGTWVEIYRQPNAEAQVSAMAFDPVTPSTFYAGLSSGTLLKTTDGGETWKNLVDFGDRVKQLEIGAGPGRTIYVMLKNKGLRTSGDGGQSWGTLLLPDNPGAYNHLILGSGGLVYVAANTGLYQSFDGARTWKRLLLPVQSTSNDVSAVAVDPKNSRVIYAAIRYVFYKSDDSGATWQTVSLPTRRLISDIAVNPNEPNKIYVGLR